jgi:hypothetical protein
MAQEEMEALAPQSQEALHKHAFWLYGVIVGLAIKEALSKIVPHLMNPPDGPWWADVEDFARLIIFIFLVIRFYLGSAFYFEEAYTGPNHVKYVKKNYFLDFLFGLTHFVLFFGWSLSIDFHDTKNEAFFRYILVGILLYDVMWFFMCRKYDTRHLMKLWAALNIFTVSVCVSLYFILKGVGANPAFTEGVALLPVFLVSIIDMAEITSRRRIFAGWLTSLTSRHE